MKNLRAYVKPAENFGVTLSKIKYTNRDEIAESFINRGDALQQLNFDTAPTSFPPPSKPKEDEIKIINTHGEGYDGIRNDAYHLGSSNMNSSIGSSNNNNSNSSSTQQTEKNEITNNNSINYSVQTDPSDLNISKKKQTDNKELSEEEETEDDGGGEKINDIANDLYNL